MQFLRRRSAFMPATSAPTRILHLETAWSTAALRAANRVIPEGLLDFLTGLGVWIAVLTFSQPRRNSRNYLTAVLGRPPLLREIWRHYREFTRMHMLRLNVATGQAHSCRATPGCDDFSTLMKSQRPALLGSFHIGDSDLLGFFLGQFRRHIYMVRFRLGDPGFLRQLATRCSAWVTFIWVNEAGNLLFALKEAVVSGGTVAMKCDRVAHSSKLEAFQFLGARRQFPFTIYHLGLMFQRPVTFCVSIPAGPNESEVRGFPVFEPNSDSKESNLRRAREHFQSVLSEIEILLRSHPYLWFNFAPLNPEVRTVSPAMVKSPDLIPISSAACISSASNR
jgi:predicted LPLAT superfamily acyltransferase